MYKQRAKRRKLKINDDTLTSIVVYSLVFCVLIVLAGYIFAAKGIDTSSLQDTALRTFGTELGICGILKLHDKFTEAQDRRREERRKRREEMLKQMEGADQNESA